LLETSRFAKLADRRFDATTCGKGNRPDLAVPDDVADFSGADIGFARRQAEVFRD
jgi:hypothetical protein